MKNPFEKLYIILILKDNFTWKEKVAYRNYFNPMVAI